MEDTICLLRQIDVTWPDGRRDSVALSVHLDMTEDDVADMAEHMYPHALFIGVGPYL